MKIWCQEALPALAVAGDFEIGTIRENLSFWPGFAVGELAPDRQAPGEAWCVPAGLGGHIPLLEKIARSGIPCFIAINGLGDRAIHSIARTLSGTDFTFAIDGNNFEIDELIRQIVWLKANFAEFAVFASRLSQIQVAFASGAAAALVSVALTERECLELSHLLRIGRGAPRLISRDEADQVVEISASLSVLVRMNAGEILNAGVLSVVRDSRKGLSPRLMEDVVGKTLRYGIEPGEVLTFGHLL